MQQSRERIQQLWAKLQSVAAFSYSSEPGPRSRTGWRGQGQGQVRVEHVSADELHFVEQGEFSLQGGQTIDMHNRFIWRRTGAGIELSHGRRGEPVFLFRLIATAEGEWQSAQDHLCINDLYSGTLTENARGFALSWQISGPKKDEHLFYQYFS